MTFLTRTDHFLTRKNHYVPGLLRRALSQAVFAMVDRRLRHRHPGYETTVFAALPEFRGQIPAAAGGPVLFAVGDRRYMEMFGRFIPMTAAINSPASNVHLHLIGQDARENIALAELTARPKKLNLTVSWEHADLDAMDRFERGRYCQCLRFARAVDLSQSSGCPLLILDIDVLVAGDLARLPRRTWEADVGLAVDRSARDAGRRINAGAVFMNATPAARAFMREAASRMLLHALHGRFTEKLDQRCLSIVRDAWRGKASITELSHTFIGGGDGEPLIVTGRGRRKDDLLPEMFRKITGGTA
jgi:hypothetical protein